MFLCRSGVRSIGAAAAGRGRRLQQLLQRPRRLRGRQGCQRASRQHRRLAQGRPAVDSGLIQRPAPAGPIQRTAMQTATISFDPFNALSDDDCHERIRAARAKLGKQRRHSLPPLPARRRLPVRRPDRRLAQAVAPGLADRFRVRRLLRRAFHGRSGRHHDGAEPDRHPARPRRRLLDGRHGQPGQGRALLARTGRRARRRERGHPGHLHQLGGRPESLLRRARRHRVHLVERRHHRQVGLRAAARRCCSSPISTSAGGRATTWASPWTKWWSGTPISNSAA